MFFKAMKHSKPTTAKVAQIAAGIEKLTEQEQETLNDL
jgi:hypothetical protein